MSINPKLSIAIVLLAMGTGSAALAQGATGFPATGTHSDYGTGVAQTPFYYGADGKLHNGMTDPNMGAVSSVGRVARSRGVEAFAQVGPSVRTGGFGGAEARSMLSPSSPAYEPDFNSH